MRLEGSGRHLGICISRLKQERKLCRDRLGILCPVFRGLHFLIFFCILTTLGKRRPKFVAAKKQQNRVNSDRTGKAAGSRKSVRSGAQGASEGRKPGRPRRVQEPEPEQEGLVRAEVIVLGSFALAVLLFLSNFHLCGFAGDFLRGIQIGLFGLPGYVAPLVLFIGTSFIRPTAKTGLYCKRPLLRPQRFSCYVVFHR